MIPPNFTHPSQDEPLQVRRQMSLQYHSAVTGTPGWPNCSTNLLGVHLPRWPLHSLSPNGNSLCQFLSCTLLFIATLSSCWRKSTIKNALCQMIFAKKYRKKYVKRYIIQRNITDDGTAYLTGCFCPKTSIIFEKYEKSHSALLAYTCALWGFCSYLAMAV